MSILELLRKLAAYTGLHDDERVHCVGCTHVDGHFPGCLLAQAIAEEEKECEWECTGEEYGDMWATQCGGLWQFIDDGPKENKTKFCPYCGRKIKTNFPKEISK